MKKVHPIINPSIGNGLGQLIRIEKFKFTSLKWDDISFALKWLCRILFSIKFSRYSI